MFFTGVTSNMAKYVIMADFLSPCNASSRLFLLQLGVLGWCAEFSELIDSLKNLGFDGNMFVNTRTQALATCQELLKLRLDLKMQIIIMYLSSQVARLRRFLDGEAEYHDYPNPEFPLDVRTYT